MLPALTELRGDKMDHEGLVANLTDKTIAAIFNDFMTRYAMLEELVTAGEGLLRGFYHELEMLKRNPLSKALGVVDIIKARYTDRLKEYVDANFSNHNNDIHSIITLHSCKLGLEDHLLKAKVLLGELERLKNDATDKVNHDMDKYLSDSVLEYSEDDKEQQSHSVQEDAQEILPPVESVSRAILMASIYNMLKLDFTNQEKIVGALELKTSSSDLESYCMLWELRPYVKCNVIHLAWKYVSA